MNKAQALTTALQSGAAYEYAVQKAGLSAIRKPISSIERKATKNRRQSARASRRANRR